MEETDTTKLTVTMFRTRDGRDILGLLTASDDRRIEITHPMELFWVATGGRQEPVLTYTAAYSNDCTIHMSMDHVVQFYDVADYMKDLYVASLNYHSTQVAGGLRHEIAAAVDRVVIDTVKPYLAPEPLSHIQRLEQFDIRGLKRN